MKLDNIHSIRVYQAVKFDNKLSTYFVTEDTTHHRAVEIEIIPSVGVSIRNNNDHVIAPFPNVSAIRLNTKKASETRKSRREDAEKPAPARTAPKVK